jgi:hypothetical protein
MMLPPFRCRRQNAAFLLTGLSPQHGLSERSPDERSDIRIFASAEAPACRFTHAGYLLAGSHRRHSGMRRKAQTRNPWRHNITWRNGFPDVQLHIKARSPGANLMLASILSQGSRPGMTNDAAIALHLTRFWAPHLICPSCQSVAALPACRPHPKHFTFAAIPCPQEGRIAIVTDVGRGMRWTLSATR